MGYPHRELVTRKLERRKGRIVNNESKCERPRNSALEKNENEVEGRCSKNESQESESNLTDAVGSLGPHGSRINGITVFRGKKNDKAETGKVAQHVG